MFKSLNFKRKHRPVDLNREEKPAEKSDRPRERKVKNHHDFHVVENILELFYIVVILNLRLTETAMRENKTQKEDRSCSDSGRDDDS